MRGNKPRFCTRCGVRIHAPALKYCPDCRYQAKLEQDRARFRRKREQEGMRIVPETREEKYFCYTLPCQKCGVQMVGVAVNRRYCDDCLKKRREEDRQRYAQQKQSGTRRTEPRKNAKKPAETLEQWLQRHGGEVNYGKIVAREEGRIR